MPELDDDLEDDAPDDEAASSGEAESEGEEDEEEGYVWVTTGESCPQCEALDGRFFQVLPERPHDDCDCEVVMERIGRRDASNQCENEWEIEHRGNTHYGARGEGLITHWEITVTCWDGAQFATIEDVDHGDDDHLWLASFDDLEAEAWNELYERAEEIAAQNCRDDCSPPRIS